MDEFSVVKGNFFVSEANLGIVTDIKIESEDTILNQRGHAKIEDFNSIKNVFTNVDIMNSDVVKFKFSTMLNVNELNTESNFSITSANSKAETSTLINALNRTTLSWPSGTWENGPRRSAFLPYKPATVLTNLQRGNIQAKTHHLDVTQFTWHMKAGRGDLRLEDVMTDFNVQQIAQNPLGTTLTAFCTSCQNDAFAKILLYAVFGNAYITHGGMRVESHLNDTNVEMTDINERDEHGMTGLMWSSAYGQTNTVQRLLDRGSNPMVYANGRQTALHMAAFGGHHEIIRLLLAYGADVNGVDEQGNTPLMYAVCEDHAHAVYELLLNDADPCIRNNNNIEAFKLAVERNCNQAKIVLETHMMHVLSSSTNS